MSKSKWTQEQIDGMIEFAKAGKSLEETSNAMIATGWENRTVPSLRSKYRSYTGNNWPKQNNNDEIVIEDIVEDVPLSAEIDNFEPKWTQGLIILLLIAGVAVAYGWFY